MSERRAVIDVGTNSVKLLVAELTDAATPDLQDPPRIHPLLEKSEQTRLGSGFYPEHQLQPDPIARTARAVANFANQATQLGAQHIRVVGTSAARDAKNQADLIAAIEHAAGLNLEIISGEQEADWVFSGVTTDARFTIHPILIVDVGGGSTEFILGRQAKAYFRRSFSIGTVRLCERFPLADPPSTLEFERCRSYVDDFLCREVGSDLLPALADFSNQKVDLIGTGGTTTILAGLQLELTSFDRERLESVCLTRENVLQWETRLWNMPLAERRQLPGLPPNRADVILFGAAIFGAIMRQFGFDTLYPSTRGLRFAALQK